MISIDSFSASIRANGWNFQPSSFQKKLMGVVIIALAALAACYFIYSGCCKNIRVENKKPDDDQAPKIAVKEEKVAQEILQSPKHSPRDLPKDPQPPKNDELPQTEVPKVEEPKKEEQKPTSISNWDDLEAYARPLLQEPGFEIEIPGKNMFPTGKGIFPKKLITKLLENRQHIPWDMLTEPAKNIVCSNGGFLMDGWYKAGLCLYSPVFKNSVIFAQKTGGVPTVDLRNDQLLNFVRALYVELPDDEKELLACYSTASHLECSSVISDCVKKIASKIALLSFEPQKLRLFVDIYNTVHGADRDALKPAFEKYFQRAVITSGTHIPILYQLIKKQPELVDLLIAGAFEDWKANDNNESISLNHFGDILLDGLQDVQNEATYVAFVSSLIEHAKPHAKNDDKAHQQVKRLFERLSGPQVKELTRIILKHAKDPSEIVQFLMRVYAGNHATKVVTVCLEKMPPGADLQKLLDYCSDPRKFHAGLTSNHMKLLITQWRTTLDKKRCLSELRGLLQTRGDVQKVVKICFKLGVDFDKFLVETRGEKYHAHLCAAWALHALRCVPNSLKDLKEMRPIAHLSPLAKVMRAIAHLSPLADADDKDHNYIFGVYMAQHCDTGYFGILLAAMAQTQRGVRASRMGEGFFRSLLNQPLGPAPVIVRIKKAFQDYWAHWNKFDIYMSPGLSCLILPMINSEEVLEAAYHAIPQHAADRDKMIKLLKEPIMYSDVDIGIMRTYRVNLPQDVIDRIVK